MAIAAVGVGTAAGTYLFSSCHGFSHRNRSAKAEFSDLQLSQNSVCQYNQSIQQREDLRRNRFRRGAQQEMLKKKKKRFQRTSAAAAVRANGSSSNSDLQPKSTEEEEEVDERTQNPHEIRVCINKTCRCSGSLETLDIIRSLAPPNVSVQSCGCLGNCGAGPNLVILPVEMIVSHCNTATHAARLLSLQCGAGNPDVNLKALALKQQANKEFELGNYPKAEKLYSEAINLNPSGGLHFIYANRSALRLAVGEFKAALEDAEEAAKIAPQWPQAFLRQADAFSAMGEFQSALSALRTALHFDPSIRRSKSYQVKSRDLESKLALLNANA